MDRKIIVPETGLLPHRPYSPAIMAGGFIYVSGHTGSDPITREFSDDAAEQTRLAFENLQAVLVAAGSDLSDVIKVNIFMTDMSSDFQAMNGVFKEFFKSNPPARTTVGVSHLARPGLKLEIEVVAKVKEGTK